MLRSGAFVFLLLATGQFGCATAAPKLAPNAKLNEAGNQAAQKDISECTQSADQAQKERAAKGAVAGGTIAGLTGLLGNNMGEGALAGSAIGEDTAGPKDAKDQDQAKRDLIDRCLKQRGYDVQGWSGGDFSTPTT
jgi:hypothetical protein